MSLLSLLDQRRSTPSRQLVAPGPDRPTLLRMLQSAVRVPDHGKLTPWRFLLVEGEARLRLGERLAERHRELEPELPDAAIEKDRGRFACAPTVVVVVGRIDQGHRIPAQEQLLSGGCVCFALLLAAQASGFGAQWLTGWAAYDPAIAAGLGLQENERVLGFVHIGTALETAGERHRPDAAELLEEWHG